MQSINDIKAFCRSVMARARNVRLRSDRRIRNGEDVSHRVAKAAIEQGKGLLTPAPRFVSRFHGRAHMPGVGHWPPGMDDKTYFDMVRREEHEAEQREKEFLERAGKYEFPPAPERPWLTIQDDIYELQRRMAADPDQRHQDEYSHRIEKLLAIEEVLAFRRANTVPREWVLDYINSWAAFWEALTGEPQSLEAFKPDWLPSKLEVREVFRAKAS